MMILSLCNTCIQPYQILVELNEVELIKQISDERGHTCPCPRLCGGSINLVGNDLIDNAVKDPRFRDPMKISGKELYKAVKGMGLPDEIDLQIETVDAMLKLGVKDFKLDTVLNKIYLSELTMKNGVTLHLTSGPHGAQILKMTKERPNGSGNPG